MNQESTEFRPWGLDENQYCMFLHLSQLAGYMVPLAGLVLPIVMWATNKDQSEMIDQHGKIVLNWMISSFIYIFIGVILVFVIIGIPLLVAIGICSLIFTIIGAIKANEGVVYKYPLTMTFIR